MRTPALPCYEGWRRRWRCRSRSKDLVCSALTQRSLSFRNHGVDLAFRAAIGPKASDGTARLDGQNTKRHGDCN